MRRLNLLIYTCILYVGQLFTALSTVSILVYKTLVYKSAHQCWTSLCTQNLLNSYQHWQFYFSKPFRLMPANQLISVCEKWNKWQNLHTRQSWYLFLYNFPKFGAIFPNWWQHWDEGLKFWKLCRLQSNCANSLSGVNSNCLVATNQLIFQGV